MEIFLNTSSYLAFCNNTLCQVDGTEYKQGMNNIELASLPFEPV